MCCSIFYGPHIPEEFSEASGRDYTNLNELSWKPDLLPNHLKWQQSNSECSGQTRVERETRISSPNALQKLAARAELILTQNLCTILGHWNLGFCMVSVLWSACKGSKVASHWQILIFQILVVTTFLASQEKDWQPHSGTLEKGRKKCHMMLMIRPSWVLPVKFPTVANIPSGDFHLKECPAFL